MNQPTMITFASGRSVVSDYDWQGVKYRTRQLDSSGRTVATRRYVGNLVIDDGRAGSFELFQRYGRDNNVQLC